MPADASAPRYLPDLAGSHAIAGDSDTAVTIGHQAVDAVTAVSSPRAYHGLRKLHAVLGPLHTSPAPPTCATASPPPPPRNTSSVQVPPSRLHASGSGPHKALHAVHDR